MIRTLRVKFVLLCMTLVSLVLGAVFFSVYSAAEQSVEATSQEVLERVLLESSALPGTLDPLLPSLGPAQLPYFTVSVWLREGGRFSAYVTGGTYRDLEDTQELTAILQDCLSRPESEGTLEDYGLRYLREDNGLYLSLAFTDMSAERAILEHLVGGYLWIAAAAFLLLLALSCLLARWATAPVERAWAQQQQFLSDASHELKTPLTVILSNAELLSATPLEDRPARWADNIHSEAGQMKKLVEQMLTLARSDQGTRKPELRPVSLSDLAMDCALAFEPVAFEAGRPLEEELAENVEVLGDPDRLRQVISCLLDNAVKYGAEGGTITLTLRKTDRQAVLSVENPGEPIPPEHLRHLFERFYRADSSRGEQSGFGLGLAIASAIVKEHKGTLRAESDQRSTRFFLTLPLKKGSA